ncbi:MULTISPECIES: 16S rRNA (adenine(1518)-N(6)/adenine(1519)-N(6))-dimethyltransferase RsmA [unclassified Methanoregula]|uniref:16S rRNA (adenine(1518)-N(6)/adenine(1519)-N(6))- dimethyltransferase RsmA n=1 Tax=unclassified Methanoregula TaxID=2649730 RepID=UPI0009CD321E|nr:MULTISPECIES: 16S rRNA (adenine(1518)-N(6)/adenine(1519)-N(6))-dimethyltransferase RsmA [unclassified Methanoregula]OPX65569.1 MAG: putative ribosomal RNA small subunit methyltransferase A [Methanoregula sp. PtaB.Bin085]OPY35848.1 MAG: putative ribosomal RNA small subunit methyltransferase A [Methanoregula sp. PtaU1.Bin006]
MKAYHDQHFLTDQNAVNRIADLEDVRGKRVLEIGPGNGALTRALLDRGAFVHAIELDSILCEQLNEIFSDEISGGRLTVQHGDATKCPYPPFEITVSNLPYSASSKITFRLLEAGFSVGVLMYQSEFAERMVAKAGTKDCGRLSIMVQTYAAVQICFRLPPQCFTPKPQVHSTVVKIFPREPIFPINDRHLYADVVRALFSHRRKTVRNCLKGSAGSMLSPLWVERAIAALPDEILTSRPEALYLEDFATIANIL